VVETVRELSGDFLTAVDRLMPQLSASADIRRRRSSKS